MKTTELLLNKKEIENAVISHIQGAYKFQNLANSASLKTAKAIRDRLIELQNTKRFPAPILVHELDKLIKEMEDA